MFLYVITNRINKKHYVGVAKDPRRRWAAHRYGRGSQLLSQAIEEYGENNFDFEVWYEGDADWIGRMEYRTIVALDALTPTGYNLTLGGLGARGCKVSPKTRVRMSQAHVGERNAMYGRHLSKEARTKLAEKATGRRCPRVAEMNRQRVRGEHPRAKPVIVNGVRYSCVLDAADALGVNYQTLATRFRRWHRSGMWPDGFGYVIV